MAWTALIAALVAVALGAQVEPGPRWEAAWQSAAEVADPLRDVQLAVEFTSPSGKKATRAGFWDGGRTWRVRFAPDEAGAWSFATKSSDTGLNGKSGTFEGRAWKGGAVRLSADRRHLARADGKPFFWLACTAWNGALHSDDKSWPEYLGDRKSKGFSAIQFVAAAPWRACLKDRDGLTAFTGKEKIAIDPVFYQRMDRKFDEVNHAGLVAVPVLLWALGKSPGVELPDDEAVILARYMVARYGAHDVVWILGGDGNYAPPKSEKWRKIGRAVFADDRSRLVAMHCGGQQWPLEEFRKEPWFDLLGYQSGHGDGDAPLKWLCAGPPTKGWKGDPAVPIINMEPNYEGHIAYSSKKAITDFQVRRAAWWSCLVAPTAGVTYGAHGLWWWSPTDTAEPPLDHPRSGVAPPWREAAALPGSVHMKHLRSFFDGLEWWRLRPAPEILMSQPGGAQFIAAARTEKGDFAVIYVPDGKEVPLNRDVCSGAIDGYWYNPREGKRVSKVVIRTSKGLLRILTEGPGDWVLLLERVEK